ncbi:MAG: pantoate--beta-alanine ligase [Candidatus Omnitrophica bacterium]|nr:pantoate--beta-alanine ligase [Candidatus Omnitrophota bacterium]
MKVIRGISQMRAFTKNARAKEQTIGFVPTMGALHEGHLSLIRRARRDCDKVAVSIFVNPAQFGPKEDFKSYPRHPKKDLLLCGRGKVDAVFMPAAKDIYPPHFCTYVSVSGLSDVLCGRSRIGHFRGVATIVAKLFNIIEPDVAYFGQKDAQQAIIIGRMARDLNMPVNIRLMPTIREPSGLAKSSRNAYLSLEEKQRASVLYRALKMARELIRMGHKDASKIKKRMQRLISAHKITVEYISMVDLVDLAPVTKLYGTVLIALAARIGKTRLIDNIIVKI